jgi:hypothetical protein
MKELLIVIGLAGLFLAGRASLSAHETGDGHRHDFAATNTLPFEAERRGPVTLKASQLAGGTRVSGQGYWRFVAAPDLLPIPAAATGSVTRAHGTLVVDAERDMVYWGLKAVGWVGFSNGLRDSWIVASDERFRSNNLHGADLLPRRGKLPLVAAADNEGGAVYLSDTTFQRPQTLRLPELGAYRTNSTYRPTDVAFVSERRLFVTDGYAQRFFLPITLAPFAYEGEIFGGKTVSQTPHGITYDPQARSLLISARPEGQIKRWSVKDEALTAIEALPVGTLVCDVDLWKHYALVACLDGAEKQPGPLMIVNLKTRKIVSVIKPKAELSYASADHIHDAAWYFRKRGRQTEVYLLFTSWNPGGIGALRLVNPGE